MGPERRAHPRRRGADGEASARSRRITTFSNDPFAERIHELTRYAESGAIRPVVDAAFPMAAVVEAHRRLEAGGVRGKYVIDVERTPVGSVVGS